MCKIRQCFWFFLVIVVLEGIEGRNVWAKPTVKLVIDPNQTTILIGAEKQERTIEARSDDPRVKFRWKLEGPGSLAGEINGPAIIYIPPDTIEYETAKAVITVTVTNSTGEVAESVTFTLKKGSGQNSITQLLSEGDLYFRNRWLVTTGENSLERAENPEASTAFNRYRQVLEIEPQNERAWDGMRNILEFYNRQGQASYERWVKNNYEDTSERIPIGWYDEQYLWVAERLRGIREDSVDPEEIKEVQERLDTFKARGYIRVFVDVPNVQIFINDEPVGMGSPDQPFETEYDPGTVTIRAEVDGKAGQSQKGIIQPNNRTEFNVTLSFADILNRADDLFKSENILPNKNERDEFAFYLYQEVLEQDTQNEHARKKIQDIIDLYKKWGDEFSEKCRESGASCGSAKKYYEKHQFIAEYRLNILKDSSVKESYDEVGKRLKQRYLQNVPSAFSSDYAKNYKNP